MTEYIWQLSFCSGLPHSIWCFLALSICLQISRCSYFFLLCSTPLCTCTTFSIAILWSRGIWVVSQFWLWQTMLLWTWLSACPRGTIEHPLDVYPKVVLLGLEEGCFLIFWEIATLTSKGAVWACIPTKNAWVFPLPHNLSSISCHQCFWSWSFLQV